MGSEMCIRDRAGISLYLCFSEVPWTADENSVYFAGVHNISFREREMLEAVVHEYLIEDHWLNHCQLTAQNHYFSRKYFRYAL